MLSALWLKIRLSSPAFSRLFGSPFIGLAESKLSFDIKQTPWFHSIWYAAMDDPAYDHLCIQGPREHAKTTCVLTYALKCLAENHKLRIGIVSGADDLAMKFLVIASAGIFLTRSATVCPG